MATNVSTANGTPRQESAFRYTHNIYFEDGLWLTGILCGLLYLTVAASLDAAGYVDNMGLLIPVTLGALLMSVLMTFSRFDSFFAFSHGMFTGLAWILYLMSHLVSAEENRSFLEFGFPELQANVYFVLYRLLNWTQLALGREATADNFMFIFEICFLVWWLTYLGIWSIFRHGYTWRAIVPAGIVLLINTYYAPKSIIAFLIFFAFIALLLLVRTNLAEQQVRWRTQRTYFSQDISLDFMRTGFTYTLLVLVLAWMAPSLGRSPVVRDIVRPVSEVVEKMNDNLNRLYPELNRQTRATAAAFGGPLTLGGERNVGNNIVFTVSATRGRYWRAIVFDTYNGRQWLNTAENTETFDDGVTLPIADWQLREPITQTVTLQARTGDVVFGAPDIVLTDLPLEATYQTVAEAPLLPAAAATASEGAETVPVELTFARSRRTLDVNSSYSIVSYQTTVTQRALREASTAYPTAITEKYLQLPEDFSPQVTALAQEIISNTARLQPEVELTVFDQVKAIESQLRTIPYSDTISAPAPDVDPIEYFLFDIQTGYCDYYATAMATMLRTLGIPARTVSGYAEGTYDEESRLYYITERDAHTWVEVYFPDYGWIEFEPTAGESSLQRPLGVEPQLPEERENPIDPGAADLNDPNFPPEGQFEEPPIEIPPLPGPDSSGLSDWPWWVWVFGTPLLLIVGLLGLRFIPSFGAVAFTADLPAVLYGRLQQWTQRLGIQTRETDTPYEQGQRLSRSLPEGRNAIQQITHEYVRYRFSGQGVTHRSPSSGAREQATNRVPLTSHMHNADSEQLEQSWKKLETVFWKAWLRRFYYSTIRRRSNPFALHRK